MHKWWKLAVGSMMAAAFLTAGCGTQSSGDTGSNKLKVMTTFYPMYEFSKQVATAGDIPLIFITTPASLLTQLDRKAIDCPVLPLKRQLVPPWKRSEAF